MQFFKIRRVYIACLCCWFLAAAALLSAQTDGVDDVNAQEPVDDGMGLILDADAFWDQEPFIVEKKIDISFLEGWGFMVLMLYLLGVVFTVFIVHFYRLSNSFAYELIILYYLFWPIFIPFSLWVIFTKRSFN